MSLDSKRWHIYSPSSAQIHPGLGGIGNDFHELLEARFYNAILCWLLTPEEVTEFQGWCLLYGTKKQTLIVPKDEKLSLFALSKLMFGKHTHLAIPYKHLPPI